VQKKIQIFLLIAKEMAILSVFLQKEGLGPLGVKIPFNLVTISTPQFSKE